MQKKEHKKATVYNCVNCKAYVSATAFSLVFFVTIMGA